MSKASEKAFVGALSFPLIMGSVALMYLYEGWAVSVVWRLVAVPVWELDPLSIPAAIGAVVLARMLTRSRIYRWKGHEEDWTVLVAHLLIPILSVATAWIAMSFYGGAA